MVNFRPLLKISIKEVEKFYSSDLFYEDMAFRKVKSFAGINKQLRNYCGILDLKRKL